MGGDLPRFNCSRSLSGFIPIALRAAGFNPKLDPLAGSRPGGQKTQTCVLCGRQVELPWHADRCRSCKLLYIDAPIPLVVPKDWSGLSWEIGFGGDSASVIFEDLQPGVNASVCLLGTSDRLYPTLSRVICASGGRLGSAKTRERLLGFDELFLIPAGQMSLALAAESVELAAYSSSEFADLSFAAALSRVSGVYDRPLDGCEIRIGPCVDPLDGAMKCYLAAWTDIRVLGNERGRHILALAGLLARRHGGQLVDPVGLSRRE